MAIFLPKAIKRIWRRDPWVTPENRVTRSLEGHQATFAVDDEDLVIGAEMAGDEQPDGAA